MAEIFEFPTDEARNWGEIDRDVRAELVARGFSAAAIDHAVAVYKDVHDRHLVGTFKAAMPEACAHHVRLVEAFFRARIGALSAALLEREAYWYDQTGPGNAA